MKYKYQLASTIKYDNYGKYTLTLQLTDLKSKKEFHDIRLITEHQNQFYNSVMYMIAAIKSLLEKFHPTCDLNSSDNIIEIQKNIKDVQIKADENSFIELWDVYYKYGDDN